MKVFFVKEKKNLYKANLHAHTTLSDGNLTPEQIKERYLANGYSVVAFTDHDLFTTHNDLTDSRFLALNAQEAQIDENPTRTHRCMKTYHFNFYAKRDDIETCPAFPNNRRWISKKEKLTITEEMEKNSFFCYYSQDSVNRLIEECNKQGFFACYNHPGWSMQNYSDYGRLKGLWGIEVFNSSCDVDYFKETTIPFQDLLKEGNEIFPVCADDCHEDRDSCLGWVMISADELKYDTIVKALLDGDFYASTGPVIKSFYYENEMMHMEAESEIARIDVIGSWRYRKCILPPDGAKSMTVADFSLHMPMLLMGESLAEAREKQYVRFEIVGTDGKIAYTKAVRVPELVNSLK